MKDFQTKSNLRVDRRGFLGTGSALLTAALSSTEAVAQSTQDLQKIRQGESDRSASDDGPENVRLKDVQPATFLPPETDHGEVPNFWQSFSASHRRIQPVGWSRQITVRDFPLSKDIAGVNMRLIAGGCRELHWHNAGEWAIMLSGDARITAMDFGGKGFVDDVEKDDLWFFPTCVPHSIQGLAPDTTLISDWTRYTPPEVLAKNWGVSQSAVAPIYKQPPEVHYIFNVPLPPSLDDNRRAAAGSKGLSPQKFPFSLSAMTPTFRRSSGEVRIIDMRNFPVSNTIAAAHVRVKPGGLRELHWLRTPTSGPISSKERAA